MIEYYMKRPELVHRLRYQRAYHEYAASVGRAPSTIRRRYAQEARAWPAEWELRRALEKEENMRKLVAKGDFKAILDMIDEMTR